MNFIRTIKSSEEDKIWLSTGSGLVEIYVNPEDIDYINNIAVSGDNLPAVENFINLPYIKEQLSRYSDDTLRKEVQELGIDEEELDRKSLEQTLLWNLSWDFKEGNY